MAGKKRDYYEVLGITKSATPDEIKKAFRQKAMEFHPDRNKAPDAEAKFKEVNEAYEVLSVPEKRSVYDKYGHEGVDESNRGGSAGGFSGGFEDIFNQFFGGRARQSSSDDYDDDDDDEGPGDMFANMFGGGRKKTPQKKGVSKDIEAQINISFVEMVKGVTKPISYKIKKVCPHCHGTGAATPSDYKTCPHCNGRGVVAAQKRTIFGVMSVEEPCPYCHGTGKIITNKCKECGGAGYLEATQSLNLNIPSGIQSEQIIKYAGYGNEVEGGKGDLKVRVFVTRNKYFERDQNKIYTKALVDPIVAVAGGTIKIPTP
jgi:molecular chaperone DnaJ